MVRERLRHGVPGLPLLPLVLLPLAAIPLFRAGGEALRAGNNSQATVLFVITIGFNALLGRYALEGRG